MGIAVIIGLACLSGAVVAQEGRVLSASTGGADVSATQDELPAEPQEQIVDDWRDEDLLKAIEYDDELNTTGTGNQQLAEKHYLAYLAKEKDAYCRAWVYTHLGLLFSTNFNESRGEKADYVKAQNYFRQAIDLQPETVSIFMLRARLGMAVPMASKEDLLDISIAGYKWMKTVREAGLREKWMPDFYPPTSTATLEGRWKSFSHLFEKVWQTEGKNLSHTAMLTDKREQSLRRIMDEFPDTPAAVWAARRLSALTTKVADRVLDERIVSMDATEPGDPTVPQEPVGLPLNGEVPKTVATQEETPSANNIPWITIALVLVGMGALGGGLYWRRSRRASR